MLWTDSAYVVTGISAILDAGRARKHETNEDLWEEIALCLLALPAGAFRIQHVASDRDPDAQADEVDAWTAQWNAFADRQARRALSARPIALQECQREFEQAFFQSAKTRLHF